MPTQSHVIIRPHYFDEPFNITRYGATFFTQIINANALETEDPILVNIFGHGNNNIIVCQHDEILLQGGMNTNILAGRVVYDLSCRAGSTLADHAINEGCIAFLGYVDDFVFYIDDNIPEGQELSDEVARGYFESHNAAPISYIGGAEPIDSYYASQDTFNYWIEIWGAIDSFVTAELVWDRDHQVMKPFTDLPPIPARAGIFPLLISLAPLALIPLMKNLNKTKTFK